MLDYDSQAFKEKPSKKKEPVVFLALEFVENGELFDLVASTGAFS